jgi:type I restriction-modification system DNA methylase subunit
VATCRSPNTSSRRRTGLRGSVESAEYKHLVLGLLFLKYVSDSFELRRGQLEAETRQPGTGVYTEDEAEGQEILEDRDEYAAENVFWVPVEARWDALLAAAADLILEQARVLYARWPEELVLGS